ncbi:MULTISPECIES: restriction endonuclease [unclassified Lysobacter]
MSTVSLTIAALVTTLLAGGAATVWLWLVHRQRLVVAAGLRALAAMRWREFSRFVIEALQAQGFNASRLAPDADRGQNADLLLTRGDQIWLLSCKQGVNYRIDDAMVSQLARAVHDSQASGGILATLGSIQTNARKHPQGIELIDGATLWPLIEPLLPPSLHQDLNNRARARTIRAILLAWLVALLLGAGAAMALWTQSSDAGDNVVLPAASSAAGSPPRPSGNLADVPQPVASGTASSEADEDEPAQRLNAATEVSTLPGIERASWATQSTFLVHLQSNANDEQVDRICDTLQRNGIHSVRVQLQPPPGSDALVRFLQCRPMK